MARSSASREQQTEESREAGRSLMKREKYRTKNGWLQTPRRTRMNDFCDFDKPRKRAYRNGKIESNKQGKEGGQLK